MDIQEQIKRIAESEADTLLLRRILDKKAQAETRGTLTYTRFLTDRERELAKRLLSAVRETQAAFFGGYAGAERTVLLFRPDWMTETEAEDGPIVCLRLEYPQEAALCHRDILGALMGLGISRETVGDILVSDDSADVLILREAAEFVTLNLKRIGRAKLSIREIQPAKLQVPEQKYELRRDTVAALRLDCVVSAGFGLSRQASAELIRANLVQLNHGACQKPDRLIAAGDLISVRGRGKIRLETVGNPTKKNRYPVVIERYV